MCFIILSVVLWSIVDRFLQLRFNRLAVGSSWVLLCVCGLSLWPIKVRASHLSTVSHWSSPQKQRLMLFGQPTKSGPRMILLVLLLVLLAVFFIHSCRNFRSRSCMYASLGAVHKNRYVIHRHLGLMISVITKSQNRPVKTDLLLFQNWPLFDWNSVFKRKRNTFGWREHSRALGVRVSP